MNFSSVLRAQLRVHHNFLINLTSLGVSLHGAFIVASTLLEQIGARRTSHVSAIAINIPLLIGLSLLYLSYHLRRRKHTAWMAAVAAYSFYLLFTLIDSTDDVGLHAIPLLNVARGVILPLIILGLLYIYRRQFTVRSDAQGFRSAVRFALVILVVALLYGVAGFSLLDKRDFHQEISPASAVHYTLDQFDLTTQHPIHPYTKRAKLFVDSLSLVSIVAVGYAAIAFFQPLRGRFGDQTANRLQMGELLRNYSAVSEDFFKLWPHDKQYFFDDTGTSGLAFHVYRGVALILGDPAGNPKAFGHLLKSFDEICARNDWLPSLIHAGKENAELYQQHDFTLQKIGQEAVVDLEHYRTSVARNKYFRHINNKFTKQDYTCELLKPPHHDAVLDRLRAITADWLKQPGHVERGYAMGYYTDEYMQQCEVMVVRDAAGTIQAFLNLVPAADFDKKEATFDLLRHTHGSPGNINDFLLINFIDYLHGQGYSHLNLGLCPLVGLDAKDDDDNSTLIDGFLRFTYANGDRFYSFSGLQRFKSKYEPEWRDRYVAYQGGLRGFSRTMNALMRAMRVHLK